MIAVCKKCGNRNILKVSEKIEGKRIAFICKGKKCEHRIEVDIPLATKIKDENRKTLIISSTYGRTSTGKLIVDTQENHKDLILRIGVNVIGRKSTSSQADLQLDIDDKYMSRMHTVIVVTQTSSNTEYLMRDYDSKNNTQLNGTPLRKGEEIYLASGDRILLGQTTLTFKTV